jgi:hypothetical protein
MPSAPDTDLETLTAEVLRLKREGVGSVERVEFFGAGLHRDGESPYTREQIETIAQNFRELSEGDDPLMPVLIGLDHVEGGPAVGRVTKVWVEPGAVLCCSLSDVPRRWAEAIRLRLWGTGVSAEIEQEPPFGLPGEGPTLVGLTLLGRLRAQLKWTSEVSTLIRYAERHTRIGSRTRLYSEVVMDRGQLEEQLKAAGLSEAEIEALKALDDDAFMAFATAMLARMAGVTTGGADDGTSATEGMAREDMIAKILELDPGQDRAALEALDDMALKELLIQLGGPDAFAEADGDPETTTVPTPTPTPTPPRPQPTPTPSRPAPELGLTRAEFAEARRTLAAIKRERREFDVQVTARKKAEQKARHAAEYAEAVAVVDQLISERKARPADKDAGDPASPNWTLVDEILAHDNTKRVHRYSEGGRAAVLTARERFVKELKRREPRKYGEAVRAGKGGDSAKAALYAQIAEETKARYAAANARPAVGLRERLGMLPPRLQR